MSENKEAFELITKAGISENDLHGIETLVDSYAKYSNDINKKKINFGFPVLNDIIRGLRVQELLTVVAGTGIGKSALALNFLLNFVKNTNELTVLFSLEMSSVGIGERIFQIELDKFGFEIENGFVKQDKIFIENCRNLKSSLRNFIVIVNRIDVHKIPDYIKAIETIQSKKVRLIAVDYLGLMDNYLFPKDEYLRTTDNMKKLYSYAKKLDVAIINLSQTSRVDVKGNNNGLSLYSGKGSGEVENSSDFFLTLERIDKPDKYESDRIEIIKEYNELNNEMLDLMKIAIHKNRRGKTGIVYVTFNRKNLRIKEYNESDFINVQVNKPKDITL